MSVSATSSTITPTFRASTAGRNWIFASHPNQAWIVPVKSRNRSVMSVKHNAAAMILIFRNIIYFVSFILCNGQLYCKYSKIIELLPIFCFKKGFLFSVWGIVVAEVLAGVSVEEIIF
jgi:hypothetical protein